MEKDGIGGDFAISVHNFAPERIETLRHDAGRALAEGNARFYDKGTTAVANEALDAHVRWQNARCLNEDSNVIRSNILLVRLSSRNGTQYDSFHIIKL